MKLSECWVEVFFSVYSQRLRVKVKKKKKRKKCRMEEIILQAGVMNVMYFIMLKLIHYGKGRGYQRT
jgi:hypothetical protein